MIFSFMCNVLLITVCPFVLFLLAIMLFVLRLADIFKPFLSHIHTIFWRRNSNFYRFTFFQIVVFSFDRCYFDFIRGVLFQVIKYVTEIRNISFLTIVTTYFFQVNTVEYVVLVFQCGWFPECTYL